MNARWQNEKQEIAQITQAVVSWQPWLVRVAEEKGRRFGDLEVVLHDDETLQVLNRDFLAHEDWTDIITFNHNTPNRINGELHISWQRVQENAMGLQVSAEEELKRVVVHGVLHLLGYNDKTEEEQKRMRRLEDASLKMFHVEHGSE